MHRVQNRPQIRWAIEIKKNFKANPSKLKEDVNATLLLKLNKKISQLISKMYLKRKKI